MIKEESTIFELSFSENSKAHLLETTRWTKFLAISGFIFISLMILILIAILVTGGMSAAFGAELPKAGITFMSVFFFIIIAMHWYPVQMLYRFSTQVKKGLSNNDAVLVENGLRSQKNMFRYIGILLIIIFCLYVVAGVMSLLRSF